MAWCTALLHTSASLFGVFQPDEMEIQYVACTDPSQVTAHWLLSFHGSMKKTCQCIKSSRPTRVIAPCIELKPRPYCDWRLVWCLVVSLYSAHDVWLAALVTGCPFTQLYMVGSAFQALLLSCSLQESIKHASSRRRDSIFTYVFRYFHGCCPSLLFTS